VRARLQDPRVTVSVVFVAGMFMNILDTTIVNVALPHISSQFHVNPSSTSTVAVGYLISLAVFIPASGWLGDRWGSKRIFMIALSLFTVSSGLCGLAQSVPELVLFRVLQGVGGGMMLPVGLTMLYRTFPPEQRMAATRVLVIPTAVAPATGPVLGGLLVDELSWRWVFWVNLPIGVAALAFGLRYLGEQRSGVVGRFDWRGFVCAGVGLGALMYGLSEGASDGWGSTQIVVALVASVALLILLVVVERRSTTPMLDLRLLGDRMFRRATLVGMVTFGGFLGLLFVFPLLLQDGLHHSALFSGLATFPEAIGVMVSAQLLVSRLYPTVGPRRLVCAGALGSALCAALLGLTGTGTNLWLVRGEMFLLGMSMANVFISAQTSAFATISTADTSQASSFFNASRQTSAAMGVAVLSTVLATIGVTRRGAGGQLVSHLVAYHVAFFVAAGLCLLGALLALRIDDRDAASTMRAPAATAGAGGASEAPDLSADESLAPV
jgi:EmrB/QacA subfamily drug resistance transporter